MATPMNFVDAIVASAQRNARYGTACLRFGKIAASQPSNSVVYVTLNGTDVPCNFLGTRVLATGQWVAVLVDGDAFLLLGRVAQESDVDNRLLPFAMEVGSIANLTGLTANTGDSRAITFTTGRFSAPPMVWVTVVSNGYNAGNAIFPITTGTSIRGFNPSSVAQSTLGYMWLAIQMKSSIGTGLVAAVPDDHQLYEVICHTPGCPNEGVPIELAVPDDADGAHCGPCGQPITDAVSKG